jgi:hypothetical protein
VGSARLHRKQAAMANALARVELHGQPEDSAQYRSLHAAMERAGFSRTIVDGNTNKTHYLPHATYYCNRHASVLEAHRAANAAAATIQTTRGHGVISSGIEIFFDGLRPA